MKEILEKWKIDNLEYWSLGQIGKRLGCCGNYSVSMKRGSSIKDGLIKFNVITKNKNGHKQVRCLHLINRQGLETLLTRSYRKEAKYMIDELEKTGDILKYSKYHVSTNLNKREKLFQDKKRKCEACNYKIKYFDILETHHIVPISKLGNNDDDNLITLCPNCHKLIHNIMRTGVEIKNKEGLCKIIKMAKNTCKHLRPQKGLTS